MSDYKIFYSGYTGERHSRLGKGEKDLASFFNFSHHLKKLKLSSRCAYIIQNELAKKIEENEKQNKTFSEKDLRNILLGYKSGKNGIKISQEQFNNLLIIANGDEPEFETNVKEEESEKLKKTKGSEIIKEPANDYERAAVIAEEDLLLEKREADLAEAKRNEREKEIRRMSEEL